MTELKLLESQQDAAVNKKTITSKNIIFLVHLFMWLDVTVPAKAMEAEDAIGLLHILYLGAMKLLSNI